MTTITNHHVTNMTNNPAESLRHKICDLNRQVTHRHPVTQTRVFAVAKIREQVALSDEDREFIHALTNGGVRRHVALNR